MLDKLRRLDWSLIIILGVMMICSTLLVHSATLNDPRIHIGFDKILQNWAVGFLAFIVFTLFDYRLFEKIHWYLYGVGIASLIAVMIFGEELNGAKSWFVLPGGFNFQPAELVKLLLIITLSMFLSRREREKLGFVRDIIPAGIIMFVPFVLVVNQPDLGNAIIYLVVFMALLWIGNIKYTHAFIGLAVMVAGIALFLYLFQHFHDPLKQYFSLHGKGHWVDRIATFVDPDSVDKDKTWQVNNAMTAIGSGGLFGEGYLQGTSIHSNFIPLAYSDSIFVVVGEEFGFVGASVLLLLYFLLIYRMILISIQSQTFGGSLIIAGIVSMFVFQIFENVGMLIGIMPLTGITLPFISYGGTSLMINMICIGIVMSIRIHRDEPSKY